MGAVACVAALPLAACRSGGDASSTGSCTQLAFSRNAEGGEGLAEVLVVAEGGEPRLVTGDWVATRPSLSPDGNSVAVVRADGDYESSGPESTSLWIVGTDAGDERALTDGPADDMPAWSPDGTQIAYVDGSEGEGRVLVVPADGGEPRAIVDLPGRPFVAPAWSPDGERLAVVARDPEAGGFGASVWTVRADGSDLRELVPVRNANWLDWHPDGELLLVSLAQHGIFVVDVATGELDLVSADSVLGAWAPDGGVYYFAADEDPPAEQWALSRGRIEDGELVRQGGVAGIGDHYIYPYAGLDTGRCATGG